METCIGHKCFFFFLTNRQVLTEPKKKKQQRNVRVCYQCLKEVARTAESDTACSRDMTPLKVVQSVYKES